MHTVFAKRGLPYGTGRPERAKKSTFWASEPFQREFASPEYVCSFCSILKKDEPKIKCVCAAQAFTGQAMVFSFV